MDKRRHTKLIALDLGGLYKVSWGGSNETTLCKLVKVTPKGFNLLIVKENKMFLYPHLYPSKRHQQSINKHIFFINKGLFITKYYGNHD